MIPNTVPVVAVGGSATFVKHGYARTTLVAQRRSAYAWHCLHSRAHCRCRARNMETPRVRKGIYLVGAVQDKGDPNLEGKRRSSDARRRSRLLCSGEQGILNPGPFFPCTVLLPFRQHNLHQQILVLDRNPRGQSLHCILEVRVE
jgi:hypothetical protein